MQKSAEGPLKEEKSVKERVVNLFEENRIARLIRRGCGKSVFKIGGRQSTLFGAGKKKKKSKEFLSTVKKLHGEKPKGVDLLRGSKSKTKRGSER